MRKPTSQTVAFVEELSCFARRRTIDRRWSGLTRAFLVKPSTGTIRAERQTASLFCQSYCRRAAAKLGNASLSAGVNRRTGRPERTAVTEVVAYDVAARCARRSRRGEEEAPPARRATLCFQPAAPPPAAQEGLASRGDLLTFINTPDRISDQWPNLASEPTTVPPSVVCSPRARAFLVSSRPIAPRQPTSLAA